MMELLINYIREEKEEQRSKVGQILYSWGLSLSEAKKVARKHLNSQLAIQLKEAGVKYE